MMHINDDDEQNILEPNARGGASDNDGNSRGSATMYATLLLLRATPKFVKVPNSVLKGRLALH